MGFTDVGKSGTALLLANTGTPPGCIAIGTGSGEVAVSNVKLVAESSRKVFTSTDITSTKEITYQGDWNSIELSGTTLTEFAIFPSGAANIGSCYSREGFAGIVFDGTNELQIQVTYRVI